MRLSLNSAMVLGGAQASLLGSPINARWTGLQAGWHLDETSDGSGAVSRADVLGTYTLTDNNTTPSAAGKISNAASFTAGNSEYLSVATTDFRQSGDFSVSAWLNLSVASPAGDIQLVSAMVVGVSTEWYFRQAAFGTNVYFTTADSSSGTGNAFVASGGTGAWHMYTAVYDSTTKTHTIYKDDGATSDTSNALTNGLKQTSTSVRFGHNAAFAGGLLDEVYVWQRKLSTDEISALYNSGAGRAYPD